VPFASAHALFQPQQAGGLVASPGHRHRTDQAWCSSTEWVAMSACTSP
jgi:hypothetical protein